MPIRFLRSCSFCPQLVPSRLVLTLRQIAYHGQVAETRKLALDLCLAAARSAASGRARWYSARIRRLASSGKRRPCT